MDQQDVNFQGPKNNQLNIAPQENSEKLEENQAGNPSQEDSENIYIRIQREITHIKKFHSASKKEIYNLFNKKIRGYILNKINNLDPPKQLVLYVFLKKCPKLVSIAELWKNQFEDYSKRFIQKGYTQEEIIKILIDLDLLYEKKCRNSENTTGNIYHYPEYFDYLREIIIDYIGKCANCKAKRSPFASSCPKCGQLLDFKTKMCPKDSTPTNSNKELK